MFPRLLTVGQIKIDNALDSTSPRALCNSVITNELNKKVDGADRGVVKEETTVKLVQDFYDYLDEKTYKNPEITLSLKFGTLVISDIYEAGSTVKIDNFTHSETNVSNIKDNKLNFYKDSVSIIEIEPSSSAKSEILSSQISITQNTGTVNFSLSGYNTKNQTIKEEKQISFYRYAYSKLSSSSTPSSDGAIRQSIISEFSENGADFEYSSGDYLYLFIEDGSKTKAQTYLFGQWVDVDVYPCGQIALLQNNGITFNYYCYRIGSFTNSGKAKYRI